MTEFILNVLESETLTIISFFPDLIKINIFSKTAFNVWIIGETYRPEINFCLNKYEPERYETSDVRLPRKYVVEIYAGSKGPDRSLIRVFAVRSKFNSIY